MSISPAFHVHKPMHHEIYAVPPHALQKNHIQTVRLASFNIQHATSGLFQQSNVSKMTLAFGYRCPEMFPYSKAKAV